MRELLLNREIGIIMLIYHLDCSIISIPMGRYFLKIGLTIIFFLHIILVTEPDTPLYDADHVGSFNLYGDINYGSKKTTAVAFER